MRITSTPSASARRLRSLALPVAIACCGAILFATPAAAQPPPPPSAPTSSAPTPAPNPLTAPLGGPETGDEPPTARNVVEEAQKSIVGVVTLGHLSSTRNRPGDLASARLRSQRRRAGWVR
jgi:hypothetical protein